MHVIPSNTLLRSDSLRRPWLNLTEHNHTCILASPQHTNTTCFVTASKIIPPPRSFTPSHYPKRLIIRQPHYRTSTMSSRTHSAAWLSLTHHLKTFQTTLSKLQPRFDRLLEVSTTLADSKVLDDLAKIDESLHIVTVQLIDIACSIAGVDQSSQDPGMVVVQWSSEGDEGLNLRDAVADIERTLVWADRRVGKCEGRDEVKVKV
jgi:hypothetical protein